eukprot:3491826-Amphidinium_carterae.1
MLWRCISCALQRGDVCIILRREQGDRLVGEAALVQQIPRQQKHKLGLKTDHDSSAFEHLVVDMVLESRLAMMTAR